MTKLQLTPREQKLYDERLELIKTMLARSPYLSKSHFTNHFGYSHAFLVLIEKEHGIVFGKGERQRIRMYSKARSAA